MGNKDLLLVIVGPTASGKSGLAMEIAKKYQGEIIAADSRTVYKGMDIGTAKPTSEDQAAVPHHLLDVVNPDESFTAADFQRLAHKAIEDTQSRGKLPILVGGTGLYVDSVIYNFSFGGEADPALRAELEALSIEELQRRITETDIPMPENTQNKRYLIRALERGGDAPKDTKLRPDTLVIGLNPPKEVLDQRIRDRVEVMVGAGLVDEVRNLAEKYGWETVALRATSYKAFREYIEGKVSLEEAKAAFAQNDIHFAKRQRTWFKRRGSDIHWFEDPLKAQEYIESSLGPL